MKSYRLLIGDLFARLGWRFLALIALMSLVGLGEGIAVALLLPLLSGMGFAPASSQGPASAILHKALAAVGAVDSFGILLVIVAISTVQTLLFIALNWWNASLGRRYQRERQMELFRAFMRAKWSFIAGRKAGELTSVIVTECERLGVAFTLTLAVLSTTVVMLVYFALSLLIAWPIAVSLVAFSLLGGLALTRLYRMSYAAGHVLAPLNAELQSVLGEQFSGAKIVKATASENRAAARIDPLVRRLERANAMVSFLPSLMRALLEFIALIGIAGVFVLGNKGMGVALGNVFVVLVLFARLFPRLTTSQAHIHYLNGFVHSIDTIEQLQAAAEAEAERLEQSGAVLRLDLPSKLAVQDLTVKFGDRTVLDGVELTMAIPGMLAIAGGSGAGKSTLVHALLGLVEPSAGSIRLGSYELATAPLGAWRRAIGYVPQETILFHASVWENLTLADPAATRADVEIAVRRAHAHEFITALPEGYDTVIGDQGVKLSGGQRQRLGIARALLTNPTLLLLDEAMSALDAESESDLLHTLDALRKHMGILVVAHRLAAVRAADAICVLEAGRLVESGTWNELMARRARLYALAEAHALAP
ncbi:MAG: ABC transporter ATP-binding protein [Pseudolabrys sp.]